MPKICLIRMTLVQKVARNSPRKVRSPQCDFTSSIGINCLSTRGGNSYQEVLKFFRFETLSAFYNALALMRFD